MPVSQGVFMDLGKLAGKRIARFGLPPFSG
jgi:hypothetical protein